MPLLRRFANWWCKVKGLCHLISYDFTPVQWLLMATIGGHVAFLMNCLIEGTEKQHLAYQYLLGTVPLIPVVAIGIFCLSLYAVAEWRNAWKIKVYAMLLSTAWMFSWAYFIWETHAAAATYSVIACFGLLSVWRLIKYHDD